MTFSFEMLFFCFDSKSRKDVRIVDDFNLLLKSCNNAFCHVHDGVNVSFVLFGTH